MTIYNKRPKKVPAFWWDFEGDDVIVESDDNRYPVIARFSNVSSIIAVEMAEKVIKDLEEGKIDYKVFKKYLFESLSCS